jgi:hypothetical protein
MRTSLGLVAIVALSATVANAADMPVKAKAPPAPAPVWVWEVGARYWYSSGRNKYDLYYDSTPSLLVSRLDYDKLKAHSGEAFFRVDSPYGVFVKGYFGGGVISGGNLFDEDFPPIIDPYSRTISDAKGNLNYASMDLGYTFYDGRAYGAGAWPVRLGAFVGFHYWHETVDAKGCSQTAGSSICAGIFAIPNSIPVITEEDKWRAFRAGGVIDVWLTPALKLTAEAAYAAARLNATDTHYFTFGRDPATGNGHGFHAEAVLSYQLTNVFNVGIGGRWWHYKTDANEALFGGQLLTYKTDRYGVFAQAGMKFGEPVVSARY